MKKLLTLIALILALALTLASCGLFDQESNNNPGGENSENGGNTDEGNTDEGNTDEGNTDEGNTDEGNTDEGNTDEGNTDEGNTDEGNNGNDNVEAPCNHEWGEESLVEVEGETICVDGGTYTKTCTKCGDVESRTVEPTGHDWYYVEVVEHTQTESGVAIKECHVCKISVISDEILHVMNNREIPANCLEPKRIYQFCEVCGFVGEGEYVGEPLGHDFTKAQPVTEIYDGKYICVDGGYLVQHCQRCMNIAYTTVAPGEYPHTIYKWNIIENPTADNHGVASGVCSICGAGEYLDLPLTYGEDFLTEGNDFYAKPVLVKAATCVDPAIYELSVSFDFNGNAIAIDELEETVVFVTVEFEYQSAARLGHDFTNAQILVLETYEVVVESTGEIAPFYYYVVVCNECGKYQTVLKASAEDQAEIWQMDASEYEDFINYLENMANQYK